MRFVVRIEPDDDRGKAAGPAVLGDVARDHIAVAEALAQLKAQFRVAQLTPDQALGPGLGAQGLGMPVVARQPATGHDALEVHGPAQVSPGFVEKMAQTTALQRGIDKHLGAVARAAGRVMVFKGAGAGDVVPAVRLGPIVPAHDQRAGIADHAVVRLGHHLALGENLQLPPSLAGDQEPMPGSTRFCSAIMARTSSAWADLVRSGFMLLSFVVWPAFGGLMLGAHRNCVRVGRLFDVQGGPGSLGRLGRARTGAAAKHLGCTLAVRQRFSVGSLGAAGSGAAWLGVDH